jgi:hypothetical protein
MQENTTQADQGRKVLNIGLYNTTLFVQNGQEILFPSWAWKMTAGVVGCPAA